MNNAREAALLTLYKIEYEGAYSNIELKNMLSASDMPQKDIGLTTALVYGVLQRDVTLEYIISCFSNIKIKKISKYILLILKLGIYQLLYMDKIPESAAVNESVKLAKRYGHAKSAGFVNGLLRNVLRNDIPKPKDYIDSISAEYSFPKELVQKWIDEFGESFACGLMSAMNETAPMCVRVNTLKTTVEEMLKRLPGAKKGKLAKYALISDGFDVQSSAEYNEGYITPQDEAAMLACEILNPKKGDTVIDLCAAPGGKATYIAQLMENKGKIFAFDIHEHKIRLINDNAKRLGIDIISACVNDACEYNVQYREFADKVIADVPCSGLGIIRKKPEIKKHFERSSDLAEIQYRILENAAVYLKNGGELVYSTCTVEREENEDIITRFLQEHRDFEPVDIEKFLPQKKNSGKKGYVTFYPNTDGTDGFFVAKLKKVQKSD